MKQKTTSILLVAAIIIWGITLFFPDQSKARGYKVQLQSKNDSLKGVVTGKQEWLEDSRRHDSLVLETIDRLVTIVNEQTDLLEIDKLLIEQEAQIIILLQQPNYDSSKLTKMLDEGSRLLQKRRIILNKLR